MFVRRCWCLCHSVWPRGHYGTRFTSVQNPSRPQPCFARWDIEPDGFLPGLCHKPSCTQQLSKKRLWCARSPTLVRSGGCAHAVTTRALCFGTQTHTAMFSPRSTASTVVTGTPGSHLCFLHCTLRGGWRVHESHTRTGDISHHSYYDK